MINYETILSLFDDKLTLLEYLTKIEKALKDSTLTDITVEQPSETTAIFTFVFENGDTITTPAVTLPRGLQGEKGDKGDKGNKGDKGDKGDNGVSVVSAHFNNQFHLILTLSNNTNIDAGKVKNCYIADVGVLTIGGETTSFSLSATDRANIADEDINVIIKFQDGTGGIIYYMTKKYITDTGTHYFNLQTVALNGSVIAYSANIDTTVASQTLISRTIKVQDGAIDSETATNGQVLTADGNGGAGWQNAGGGTTLTKYTWTETTWNTSAENTLKSILKNAKGNVLGHLTIRFNVAGGNKNFNINIKEIVYDSNYSSYLLINDTQACTDGTSQYILLLCIYSYNHVWTNSGCLLLKQDATVTNVTASPTFMSLYVEYYNDEQLHP